MMRNKYCNQDQKVSFGFAGVTESQEMFSSLQSIQLQDFESMTGHSKHQSPKTSNYNSNNPLLSNPGFSKTNKNSHIVYSNNSQQNIRRNDLLKTPVSSKINKTDNIASVNYSQAQRRNDLQKTPNSLRNNLLTQPTKLSENTSSRRIVQNPERNTSHSP